MKMPKQACTTEFSDLEAAPARPGLLCKVIDYGNLRFKEPKKPLARIDLPITDFVEGCP